MEKTSGKLLDHLGWKVRVNFAEIPNKAVIIAAPHTSNWDFFFGKLALMSLGLKPKILMKKELFFFPMSLLLRSLGVVPVNRNQNNSLTDQIALHFQSRDSFHFVFTPEGTRSKVNSWKKGFWYTAKKAEVPVILGYMDYKNKTLALDRVFQPGEDVEQDVEEIKNFYKEIQGKHVEKGV